MWSVKEDSELREALIKEKAVEIFQPDLTLCVVYQVGWKMALAVTVTVKAKP